MYWKEREKEKSIITKKYHQGPEKKCNELKTDIETKSQCGSIEKGNFREILNKKRNMKKKKYQENPKPKKEYEKINIRKILDKKENMKKYIRGKPWTKKRIWEKNFEKNPEPKKQNYKKMHKKNKKCFKKVEKIFKQIWQDPYFICTVCHRCRYKRSVRLFEHEKYHILIA